MGVLDATDRPSQPHFDFIVAFERCQISLIAIWGLSVKPLKLRCVKRKD